MALLSNPKAKDVQST